MPLRDHFHGPVADRHTWDSLHSGWPMMIVRQLYELLPPGYVSAPGVHFGKDFVVDVSAFEVDQPSRDRREGSAGNGGVAVLSPPAPTLTLEADLADQDEFEVRIYDAERGRLLVAAIELVSPANKDRPENRRAFVAKVSALLRKDVCVSIVDLVAVRQFNLCAELLELVGDADARLGDAPPHLYAATIRNRKRPAARSLVDVWHFPMTPGQPLPTLPIWLSAEQRIFLPLESSYEETCRLLHIE